MNDFKDIEVEYDDQYNPMLSSPNAPYSLPFYLTLETAQDVELYKHFLDNAISQFRKHGRFYKNYKSYLMSLGLDHCQIMSNVTEENVGARGIEMNHNFLTIFDIALLITEHTLNTVGYISTFDLIHLLKEEHKANRIPIVMVSETVHEMYHQNEDMIFPAQMCFGYWIELLQKYNRGITLKIAQKVVNYIYRSINDQQTNGNTINELLSVRDYVEGWSRYNEYGSIYNINNRNGIGYNNNQYNYNYPYLETQY